MTWVRLVWISNTCLVALLYSFSKQVPQFATIYHNLPPIVHKLPPSPTLQKQPNTDPHSTSSSRANIRRSIVVIQISLYVTILVRVDHTHDEESRSISFRSLALSHFSRKSITDHFAVQLPLVQSAMSLL